MARPAPCARSESLRRTFLDRVSKTKAGTRSLSGPVRAGHRKTQALSSKASTEAAAFGLTVRPAADPTPATCLSEVSRGNKKCGRFEPRTACQRVSLAHCSGGYSHQRAPFSGIFLEKAVSSVTDQSDADQWLVLSRLRVLDHRNTRFNQVWSGVISLSRPRTRVPRAKRA